MVQTDRAGRVTGARFERGFEPAFGAQVTGGGTFFRTYVTTADRVAVRIFEADGSPTRTLPMHAVGDGTFELFEPGLAHGTLYKLVVGDRELPDPYAHFLPEGVHGPAMAYASSHVWRHGFGLYRPLSAHVIYELHVGTFTEEGTYRAAEARLRDLLRLGVTAIELMPISSFGGERGWGYDGVAHFAPHAPYGTPDELRRFIDEAHGLGLSVFLDVVYNHFGPSGNYLGAFSADYFRSDVKTPWGDALDYRKPPMRRYLLENARYWLTELRFDGLRLDAVHEIVDHAEQHVLRELANDVLMIEPKKILIAEDDRNEPALVKELGLDAIWADDFHHQLHVTLTKESDGYYAGYRPGALGVADVIRRGWLYEGQVFGPWRKERGKAADMLHASAFVYGIQNHDQIGNRAMGDRLSASVPPAAYAAASALLLFLPMTPLLFQGQEWAASTPFLYFTDHDAELGKLVSKGRRSEFAGFSAFADENKRARIPDPQALETFVASKLDWSERDRPEHAHVLDLYDQLIRLRRLDPVLSAGGRDRLGVRSEGTVLVVERWAERSRRMLVVNLADVPSAWPAMPKPFDEYRRLLSSDHGIAPDALGGWAFAILGEDDVRENR